MSHGAAGVLTLYDEDGNPVRVRLVNGEYQLMANDENTHDRLDEIKVLLERMIELLETR